MTPALRLRDRLPARRSGRRRTPEPAVVENSRVLAPVDRVAVVALTDRFANHASVPFPVPRESAPTQRLITGTCEVQTRPREWF